MPTYTYYKGASNGNLYRTCGESIDVFLEYIDIFDNVDRWTQSIFGTTTQFLAAPVSWTPIHLSEQQAMEQYPEAFKP